MWLPTTDDTTTNLSHVPARLTRAAICARWSLVAKHIPGRTGQQCAQRWRHRVNPNIKREKWTPEEDRLLMRLVHQHGSAWAEISRGLEVRGVLLCCCRTQRVQRS